MHIRHARFHRKHFSNNGLFKKILFFFLSHSFLIFKAYHFTLFLLFHLPLHVWTYICHPFLMDIVLSFIFHPLPKTVPTKSYTLAYNHITDWKQILKKTSDKELLSKIYKEFLKFNNRKMSNVIFFLNGQRTLTEKSSKNIYRWQINILKDTQHLMSLKTCRLKQQYHYTPVTMAKIRNPDYNRCGQRGGARGTLIYC